jgi:hypothetical protein
LYGGCCVVMGGWTRRCPSASHRPSWLNPSSSSRRAGIDPTFAVLLQQYSLDFALGVKLANVAARALLCVMP